MEILDNNDPNDHIDNTDNNKHARESTDNNNDQQPLFEDVCQIDIVLSSCLHGDDWYFAATTTALFAEGFFIQHGWRKLLKIHCSCFIPTTIIINTIFIHNLSI